MKTIIEFGIRGGYHADNLLLPNAKLARKLAISIAQSFGAPNYFTENDFKVGAKIPRCSWSNATHFVAVSVLDGVMRGPASAALWKPAPAYGDE